MDTWNSRDVLMTRYIFAETISCIFDMKLLWENNTCQRNNVTIPIIFHFQQVLNSWYDKKIT
jgi:hypothetical protein